MILEKHLLVITNEMEYKVFSNYSIVRKIIHKWKTSVRKPNTAYQHKHLILTVKHGGGGLMLWACSAATGPGHLAVIESTMNSSVDQSILESDVRPSV